MINKAALGRRRGRKDELVNFACDLMRRWQLRTLHVERSADEVLRGVIRLACVGELIALELRVHDRRCEIPDADQSEDDGGDGEDGLHFAPPLRGRYSGALPVIGMAFAQAL